MTTTERPEQSELRPRQRRSAAWLRVLAWLVGVTLLVLAVLLAALHLLLLPRLDQWRHIIEDYASRQSGMEISLGSLSAQETALLPVLVSENGYIRDPDGRAVLEWKRAQVRFSLRGLFNGGVDSLQVTQPHLRAAVPLSEWLQNRGSAAALKSIDFSSSPAWRWLLAQPRLSLDQGEVDLVFADVLPKPGSAGVAPAGITLSHVNFVTESNALENRHTFSLSFDVGQGQGRLAFTGDLRGLEREGGPERPWPAASGTVQLQAGNLNFSALPAQLASQWQLAGLLNADLRLQISNGEPEQLQWDIQGRDLQFGQAQAEETAATDGRDVAHMQWPMPGLVLQRLASSGTLTARGRDNTTLWQLENADLEVARETRQWRSGPITGELKLDETGAGWPGRVMLAQLQVDHVDLASVAALLSAPVAAHAGGGAGAHAGLADGAVVAQSWTDRLQTQLQRWQPHGNLQDLVLSWKRLSSDSGQENPLLLADGNWSASARLDSVTLGLPDAAAAANHGPAAPFGVRGLSGSIEGSATGGRAQLQIEDGMLALPSVFEQPDIAVKVLRVDMQWDADAQGDISVSADVPELANADARGRAQVHWRTSTAQEISELARTYGSEAGRFPGYLDLNATLTQADGARVWRYLPMTISQDVRRYVREAVIKGRTSQANFEVRGSLLRFPFDQGTGVSAGGPQPSPAQESGQPDGSASEVFRINARLNDVEYRYVPAYLLKGRDAGYSWPELAGVDGSLSFLGSRMELDVDKGRLLEHPEVTVEKGRAIIKDFQNARVAVDVDASGPLQPQLQALSGTPVSRMTDGLLESLRGSGDAAFSLHLDIPLNDATKKQSDTTVRGEVSLAGNDLQWMPEVPPLQDVHGRVFFTDKAFHMKDVQARALGGPVRLSVAMQDRVPGRPVRVNVDANGVFTGRGLHDYVHHAMGKGIAATLASGLEGRAGYHLDVNTIGGRPYLRFSSSMQGMRSLLPAPLDKPGDEASPLLFEWTQPDSAGVETLKLHWGDRIYAHYLVTDREPGPGGREGAIAGQRKSPHDNEAGQAGTCCRVLQGDVLIGKFSDDEKRHVNFIRHDFVAAPVQAKVRAHIALGDLDLSAWQPWLQASGLEESGTKNAPELPSMVPGETFVPDLWYASFQRLRWEKTGYDNVRMQAFLGGARSNIWVLNVLSDGARGTLEYHPDYLHGTGLLRGRIAYLDLPSDFGEDKKELLTSAKSTADSEKDEFGLSNNIHSLPAIDLEIDRLLLGGIDWGRVALQAVNRVEQGQPAEWRINYLTMQTSEASLTARGSWQSTWPGNTWQHLLSGNKRMNMRFTLELTDAGRLLARFGQANVLKRGHGKIDGDISWIGSPLHLDLASLSGGLDLHVLDGQFLPVDAGAGRLLGVLSLQALPRRLALDFRDVFSPGFAFDSVHGNLEIKDGIFRTSNLQMQGVNAGVMLKGQANLVDETQDVTVTVVPEIDAMAGSLLATAINPVVGAGTFLAQLFLAKPLAKSATREFHIYGTWGEPVIERMANRPPATVNTLVAEDER